ncbi:MAG: hypothetical protein JSW11_07305 [Candidatus Heimdallarchaeota archaeon]|nr:MAG: hypothetical protein JSW11_07305 [Candidatus Heimdallarchaeota archaeon]
MKKDKSSRGAVYKNDWKYLLAGWFVMTVVLFLIYKSSNTTPGPNDFFTLLGICLSSLFGILLMYEYYIYRHRD